MKRRHSKKKGRRRGQKKSIKKRSYNIRNIQTFPQIKKNLRSYHGVHGKGIESIIDRLNKSPIKYSTIYDNLDYGANGDSTKGEFDVIAFYKRNILIFEVKSTDNEKSREKAYNQLARGKDFLSKKADRIYTFYCYFNYGCLIYENINLR